MQTSRIFNGCEVRIVNPSQGNCSSSRGLPSDAEQIPERWNFQFALKNHYGFFFLHTLPSKIVFKFPYALLYQHTLKYLHFRSRPDRFGFYLQRWNIWLKMMSKSDVMTSKRPWCQAWKYQSGMRENGKQCRTWSVCFQVWVHTVCPSLSVRKFRIIMEKKSSHRLPWHGNWKAKIAVHSGERVWFKGLWFSNFKTKQN